MTTEEFLDAIRYHDPVGSEVLGAMGKGKPLIFSLPCSVLQVLDDLVFLGSMTSSSGFSHKRNDSTGHVGGLGILLSSSSQV